MSENSAQSIKGYQLLDLIGEGAFGAVYRAHQPVVDREVAVKIILPEYASRPDFIRRFESEAQLVAQLEHLHIVPLYDYWRDPEGAFLVMRLMKGGSLEEIIQKGPLPLAQVSRMLEQVASALAAAHRREIVHRDLKPLNILLDEDGNAYLSDFGIAKALGERSDLTVTGAIMGTPAFIAPEQIQSLSVSPQTDIYSLGVVLYAMLTGEHPFPEASPGDLIARHLRDPLPDVHDIDPSLPSGIDEVIQRATAKDPAERYPDVADMLADFREAVGPELAPPPARPLIEELLEVTNPFKGLRAFQEADADDFFGREALTRRLLARLPETGEYSRFLAVVGPSGSGKSSVVKAGLLPDLRQGALNGSEEWYITEMMPGTHPLEELELALLRIAVNQPPSLLAQLKEDGRGLLRATRRILPDGAELLLVVDQFEEVFTQSVDKSEARHFMNLIYQAVGEPDSPVRVLITLRADFYDRPLMEPDFSVLVQERTEVVVPLTSEELEEAIRCPVERVGADLEEGLALTIVGDVIEQPGALPLLQYALTELFERRSGRTLTHEAYRTIGGVLGALGRRAEEDYQHQNDSGQAISRQVFLRLVSLGEGVEDTRRRVLRSELTTIDIPTATPNPGESGISVDQVIESFGVARLLSFDHDPVTRGPTIEVAHEALLQEWRRLREWLDESRADIRLQRVLENATNDWIEAGQDASFLLRGTRLDQFEAWAVSTDLSLNRGEEEYLEISLAERREREAVEAERLARETATERRSRRFLRGLVVVMGLALIMAVILTSYAIYANNQTKAQQVIAEEQADLAFSRELTEAAFGVLETDPELSALLALQALSEADTPAAQSALHQAVPAMHLVDTLVGHQGLIQGLAVSPDGQLLATASQDGTVKVWDLDAGTLLETLEFSGTSDQLEGRPPVAVAFSPDGRLLATGGFDQEVKIWELNSPVDEDTLEVNLISNLIGHTGVINEIEFSPDGSLLASAGGDKSVIIWDVDSSEQVHVLIGTMPFLNYPGGDPYASRRVKPPYSLSKPGITSSMKIENLSGVTDVAFTPGGGKLISTNADGIVSVWDPVSGEKIGQYGPFISNFRGKVIPEPITLYGEKDIEIILEKNYLRTGHYGTIFDVDMSPRGDYFATASVDGLVKIWEISNQKTPMLVINQFAFSIAFSKDGSHLAIGARDGSIHIHDMEYGREPVLLSGHSGTIYDLAFASTGELISGGVDKFIKVWNPNPAEELFAIANTHPILSVTVNPSGDLIAIGLENKSAVVLSRETGQPLYSPLVSQEIPVNAVAFSPDGRVLVTSNMDVWDARSGKVLCNLLGHSDNITDLAFSKTSSYLASSSYDNTIKIWNIKDCDVVTTPIAELVGHENWVEGIVFSPDGETIASIGWDKTVRTWDWKSEKMIGNWGSPEMPTSIGISPDGGRLAVGDQEGNLTIWDITSDTPQASFTVPGHSGFVFDLDFSSDGNLVATASSDGEVKVWDAIEGEELLSLFGHHGVATGVEFGPDGTWLISSGTDGVIRGYTLDIDLLKELAREKLTRSLTEEECQKYLHLEQCPENP